MQPATSMSRLANCAPMKKSGCVTSTSNDSLALGWPLQRRANVYSADAAVAAPISGATRAAHSSGPNTESAAAVIQ